MCVQIIRFIFVSETNTETEIMTNLLQILNGILNEEFDITIPENREEDFLNFFNDKVTEDFVNTHCEIRESREVGTDNTILIIELDDHGFDKFENWYISFRGI